VLRSQYSVKAVESLSLPQLQMLGETLLDFTGSDDLTLVYNRISNLACTITLRTNPNTIAPHPPQEKRSPTSAK
jgi:hypothetical protein